MSVDPYKLAEQGYEIFPLQVKNPGTPSKKLVFLGEDSWNKMASSDPAKISQWQARFGKRITDWGLPTGHRNSLYVVDSDSEEAEHWWNSQWLPEGKPVETPRGGLHLLYSLEGVEADLSNTQGKLHPDMDTRGEGGFVVAYTDDMSDIPVLPQSIIDIVPEKQVYKTEAPPEGAAPANDEPPVAVELPDGEEIAEVSPQEARVIKGLTDMLDALPRPWAPGSGYHSTQFLVACGLNRIANSPYYTTDRETAHKIFLAHAPLRDQGDDVPVRARRWEDAVKTTEGEWFEAPSDVPVRLDGNQEVNKFLNGTVERTFWESKTVGEVKELIRELREQGATEQQAYSISYDSSAMRLFRERNANHSGSTWGWVKDIYRVEESVEKAEVPMANLTPHVETLDSGMKVVLLSDEERDAIRNYPNFIDRYIMTAREILAEPNMPLHYVNSWIALSCIVGDRADIMLEKGRVPLSLWGMPLAQSAAGKGDAKQLLVSCINTARRGGFGDISAGGNASSEGLSDFITEREGKVSYFNKDESSSLLEGMHQEGSYESKMMTLALDLYDGEANRNLRVGNAKDGAGASVKTTFNMWLQTTWQGAVGALTSEDVGTGFVGRFLIAIGDAPKITDASLRPRFASEYQVENGNVHPMLKSLGAGINAVIGRAKNITVRANDDVLDRYVQARRDVLDYIRSHPQHDSLQGVMLRVTDNMFKGAALLAVSEGRRSVEMSDLLIAIKSGQYWVRDALRLIEAIGTSEYRKRVDALVRFCDVKPRTRAEILSHFGNLSNREVIEVLERAEQEGSIKKDREGGKYRGVSDE